MFCIKRQKLTPSQLTKKFKL
uniref:Uncharacterized protein n=1 Tax=Rhizophora mucronata TaxID=61149 RepID=A0A2P2MU76_RHIMU